MPSAQPGNERSRVADFWDQVIADWIAGEPIADSDLIRWQNSYAGRGTGRVDLEHYPDPFVGDIRGIKRNPRMVVLGLNPGIGYDVLQGRNGLWTQRIAESGYTYCLERSPAEDPTTWLRLHGKASTYWRNAIGFAQRWLSDPNASVHDIINFELYPWHSRAIKGLMNPPPELIDRYVCAPIAELPVREVFAFGAQWFDVAERLKLTELARFGVDGHPLDGADRMHWRLRLYRLTARQILVVSAQAGYSGPPGADRTARLREILDEVSEAVNDR